MISILAPGNSIHSLSNYGKRFDSGYEPGTKESKRRKRCSSFDNERCTDGGRSVERYQGESK